MNGGDEFYVRFENNESDEVTYAEVTDNDDGSYAVKFNTMVTITSFDTYDIVSFILIFFYVHPYVRLLALILAR